MAFDYRAELIRLVEALLEAREHQEALVFASRLVERFKDPQAFTLAARTLRMSGRIDEAQGLLSSILQAWPGEGDACLEMALVLQQKGDSASAEKLLRAALGIHPDHACLLSALGRLRMRQGNAEEGLRLLQRAVALAPESGEARIRLGEALLATGQVPRAMANLGRVLEQSPNHLEALLLSAQAHWAANDRETARQQEARALRLPDARKEALEAFAHLRPRPAWHPREVVFVGDRPRTRQAKLAYGLRQAGWRTVLLHRFPPNFDPAECFDEVHAFGEEGRVEAPLDAEEAVALARTFHPRAFHVFSQWSEVTSEAMIQARPGPIVYDVHDTVATIWDAGARAEEPRQRLCMEEADGLCIRDLRHQFLKRMGYRLPRPRIFFQEYCWQTADATAVRDPFPEDEVHVVASGSFDVEKLGQRDSGLLRTGRRLADQGIHLHIFPSTLQLLALDGRFETIFSDYLELGARTGYVHMHEPLGAEGLAEELRRYRAALSFSAAISYGEHSSRYDPESVRYNAGARIFEFLEAELPVVLNREFRYVFQFLSRFGLAVPASPETFHDLRRALVPVSGDETRARARQARATYSLEGQIPRLIRFYEQF